ncbi:MAG TPA: hypothetical protein VKM94_19440, partial [Blastocatellia bacterium]|nr:hypothetical protein [Blastocatellia bacterium]
VVQPRVAVRGYPGSSPQKGPNPEGVASSSPGLPSAATLGKPKRVPNPEGVASSSPGLPSAATLGKPKRVPNPSGLFVVETGHAG